MPCPIVGLLILLLPKIPEEGKRKVMKDAPREKTKEKVHYHGGGQLPDPSSLSATAGPSSTLCFLLLL